MARPTITIASSSITARECADIALASRYALVHVDAVGLDTTSVAGADLIVLCHADDELPAPHVLSGKRWIRLLSPGRRAQDPTREIAFPWPPEAIRHRVAAALAAPGPSSTRPLATELGPPLLPAPIAQAAERGVGAGLPLLLSGEAGTGTKRLARQIHRRTGGGRFLALPLSRLTPAVVSEAERSAPPGATLCVDELDSGTMPDAAAEALAMLCDLLDAGEANVPLRLICLASGDADALASNGAIDLDLFYRLAVLPLQIPPLRERGAEIDAIVDCVATRIAARTGRDAAPCLTDAARARLHRYPWPGNLAELEAVLTRSMVLQLGTKLDADDLLFDLAGAAPTAATPPVPALEETAQPAPSADPATGVDLLLQELAHELKNPMVTIKTVSQHLERLLEGESDQREMARMTGEAVDRMDRALENLLQYTRFEAPHPQATRLADVLAPCFDHLDALFSEQRVLLDDRVDPSAAVTADRAQIAYALENLLRAVVRAAGAGVTLVVRSPLTRSGLVIEFPTTTASITEKLARWSDGSSDGPAVAASISFVFARALLERNGGAVDIHADDGKTSITVALPAGDEEVEEDEEAAYLDR